MLYLDDNGPNRQAFQAAFRKEFKILLASTANEALRLLGEHTVHVLIADQRMPDMPGTEFLSRVQKGENLPLLDHRALAATHLHKSSPLDRHDLGPLYRLDDPTAVNELRYRRERRSPDFYEWRPAIVKIVCTPTQAQNHGEDCNGTQSLLYGRWHRHSPCPG